MYPISHNRDGTDFSGDLYIISGHKLLTPSPIPLKTPDPIRIDQLLRSFWLDLEKLALYLSREENLLCAATLQTIRLQVTEMILALNGIAWLQGSSELNRYLGDNQRAVLEKTLVVPEIGLNGWVGQAVALVVIYRWYAPQLVDRFGLHYPEAVEIEAWQTLSGLLPGWPRTITTG